jgi:hypothetical protein
MIVVVGSRHDEVATRLVERWPSAALCSAEDLTTEGWVWSSDKADQRRWIVDGRSVVDGDVDGVFLRRSGVHPEELVGIHPDDREYMAAEIRAFLVLVLATTGAVVVNPVAHGGLGDEVLRPERWIAAAAERGIAIAPLHLASTPTPTPDGHRGLVVVDVVGEQSFGDAPEVLRRAAVAVADALDLAWAAVVFDELGRLVVVSTRPAPGEAAVEALGRLLAGDLVGARR